MLYVSLYNCKPDLAYTSSFLSWLIVLGCLRFSNRLECAERHGIIERSAQKQQHRYVSHFSRCFVVKFEPVGVNSFCRSNLKSLLYVIFIIRVVHNFCLFSTLPYLRNCLLRLG
jgi:hypothetical protein